MVLLKRSGIPINKEATGQYHLNEFIGKDGSLAISRQEELQQVLSRLKESGDFPDISAGELNGMSLLIRIYRYILQKYLSEKVPRFATEITAELSTLFSATKMAEFEEIISDDFNLAEPEILTESIILWFCREDKAFHPYHSFFAWNASWLTDFSDRLIASCELYFSRAPKVLNDYNLFELLRLPLQKFPNSIYDQLNFMRLNFSDLLSDLLPEILFGLDSIKEETTFRGGGPGPTEIYQFADEEYERFSEDRSWMSKLVLLAKSTYVWLAQLSRKYDRVIDKLDQIPPEELQEIANRGFNGVWLIGIWERSAASRKFKQMKGNNEAIASAYSLQNYHVAADLGGDAAMSELQKKAWHFGIRIGCDMVPNHMGIDSDWIVQHPEWFLQLEHSPFQSYRFFSQNLAERPEIEIRIEDHYYDESDAAVVFQYLNKRDGRMRYIYHGNDGTSIPWNDTAQLNYLLPEVREAVIEEIIDIAKRFPVIRFDAAMTLAKRHIQRLWYPQPGSGGAIPSRAQFSLSNEEFNLHIPQEFWREVVDRVAQEAPDTLLLAEAFWMMEGYFVRTLGMHRVYNSAFMNMLKAEENDKYRASIKNVLAFNPQILKRFVNFMSNPDEDTAIAQFGMDDKYFGVCVLMATMPGLPMFAHGQIEGFTERYGMEYAKPKKWESVDKYLLERHEREIFPLLRKRYLFADVENFLLYDFLTDDGQLNENVFAYSN
nr:alpha-amylase family glycosyl hydrolase [Candidatus Cloacimonadota bacterium]